jgi:hypothetical protein
MQLSLVVRLMLRQQHRSRPRIESGYVSEGYEQAGQSQMRAFYTITWSITSRQDTGQEMKKQMTCMLYKKQKKENDIK